MSKTTICLQLILQNFIKLFNIVSFYDIIPAWILYHACCGAVFQPFSAKRAYGNIKTLHLRGNTLSRVER
jgi:hypothetical protein